MGLSAGRDKGVVYWKVRKKASHCELERSWGNLQHRKEKKIQKKQHTLLNFKASQENMVRIHWLKDFCA